MSEANSSLESCYSCERLDTQTWKIVEDDFQKGQYPFIYVISFHDRIVVIDTGCGGPEANPDVKVGSDRSASLFEFIDDMLNKGESPVPPSEPRPFHVYCTHYHFDHCGSNHVLRGPEMSFQSSDPTNPRCGEIALSVHAKDAIIAGDPSDCSLARDHKVRLKPFGVTRWLNDGDQIALSRRTKEKVADQASSADESTSTSELKTQAKKYSEYLEVMETPGHTPDSVCFIDRARKRIFVGDFIYEWTPIYVSSANSSLTQFQASVIKLKTFCEDQRKEHGINFTLSGGHISPAMDATEALQSLWNVTNCAAEAVSTSDMSAGTFVGLGNGETKLYNFASDDGKFSLVVPATAETC